MPIFHVQVSAYSTLLPLVLQQKLPQGTPDLQLYLEAVGNMPAVQKAREQVRTFTHGCYPACTQSNKSTFNLNDTRTPPPKI